MTPYHDPFAASLALVRASGHAVAAQMRCATVLARSAMDFATLRPWLRVAERAGSAPEPQRPAKRRQPAAGSKAAPKPPAPRAEIPKPRLVASSDGPAPAGKGPRRQPSAPPAMPAPERAATGTGEA